MWSKRPARRDPRERFRRGHRAPVPAPRLRALPQADSRQYAFPSRPGIGMAIGATNVSAWRERARRERRARKGRSVHRGDPAGARRASRPVLGTAARLKARRGLHDLRGLRILLGTTRRRRAVRALLLPGPRRRCDKVSSVRRSCARSDARPHVMVSYIPPRDARPGDIADREIADSREGIPAAALGLAAPRRGSAHMRAGFDIHLAKRSAKKPGGHVAALARLPASERDSAPPPLGARHDPQRCGLGKLRTRQGRSPRDAAAPRRKAWSGPALGRTLGWEKTAERRRTGHRAVRGHPLRRPDHRGVSVR